MRLDPTLSRLPAPSTRPAVSAEPAAAPRAQAQGLGDRLGGVWDGLQGLMRSAGSVLRHMAHPDGTWSNPDVKPQPDKGGLKVMTFNVMVKTTRFEQVARDIKAADADVVSLQEASEESAMRLGRALGYHVAWQEHPFHAYGGVAILSRYPITRSENIAMTNPWKERLGEFWKHLKAGEPRMAALDSRHLLHTTVKVGDRTVDLLNGHLTLFGAAINRQQVEQVAGMAADLEKQGHTVVVTGDWNSNFANAESPQSRAMKGLNYYWDAEQRSVLVDGRLITPEQAASELKSGTVEPGSDREKKLKSAAAGATLPGGEKRFDNIFASKDARFVSAHIDQTTQASDHQPAIAELRWN